MSSPTPPPVYRPPVYRPRSLAGPIVLILIGVLALLANMGVITWARFGDWFAKYWPLLIILWGVVKLLEYYQAQRAGYRPRGIGAGGVIFLVFLIFFGMAATKAAHVNWGQVGADMDIDHDLFSWFGTTYTYSDQLEQPFPAGANLQVVSDRGDVNVSAWDENKVKVVVHKRVVAESETAAKKVDADTRPQITVANNLVTVNANTSPGGQNRVATDLDIYIPRKAAVEISTRRGDVTVRGREGSVKATTSHGDITVEDVKGDAALSVRRGSTRADNVSGDVSVEGHGSDNTINAIGGNVRLNGEFSGSMKLTKVAKSVQFTSSRTDMHFARLDGEMDMDLGELRANQLAGPFSIVTRSKDIHLDDVSGDVHVENTNGEVEVHVGKLPLGNIAIDNRKGEIQLTVSAKAAFQLQAKTRHGDIESEFNEVKVDSSHGESSAAGTVGSGAASVQLNNQYGGITIRKSG